MITKTNLVRHELIGQKVTIVGAKNPTYVGICGIVKDETLNMLHLETSKSIKKIPKVGCFFRFELPDGNVIVDGQKLKGKPEMRLKK
jgi:RNase P/RNase MRP subunit p29